jgi:hypothetical protein
MQASSDSDEFDLDVEAAMSDEECQKKGKKKQKYNKYAKKGAIKESESKKNS